MKRGFVATVGAALVATLTITTTVLTPTAIACHEEGSGFVSVRIRAPLTPENAAKLGFELFNDTLTINGIALNGTATWSDNENLLLSGPVSIVGVILTTGDQTTYLENRGTLWLKYRFFDADGVTIIGTGEGFVTLERVGDTEGESSFQGSITIAGAVKQFAGTGDSEVAALIPLPPPVAVPDGSAGEAADHYYGRHEEEPGLEQKMEKTIVTGDKPGFEFETATTVSTLNAQYSKATKNLKQQRDGRRRVMKAIKR
jgi:hypothetical protein